MPEHRVGHGYDVHRLVEGRHLIIGGVEIPHERGLDGHSDADVLTHAIMDALLGAAGLRDIGKHFPPDDPAYENADSLLLLERVVQMLKRNGWTVIVNVDATIMAERPRMSDYIEAMIRNLSKMLDIATDRINVKATTTEGLGFVGREEGIAASAVCLITRYE